MSQLPAAGQPNPYGITLFTVRTPTGSDLNLQTTEEADWYEDKRDRYLADNQFPNVSDLQDLDRVILFEVMIYRWSLWLTQGFDYMHSRIDENALRGYIKDYSTELRLLKQTLGIDKATRDKEKGESLADYTASLLQRAKEFGYHRNQQYEIVVTKFYEMCAMIKTYDRCDEEERALLDLTQESILEWVRTNVIEPFDEHAESFRKEQAIWIRSM